MRRPQAARPTPNRWPKVAGAVGAGVLAAAIGFLVFRPGAEPIPSPQPPTPAPTPSFNAELLSNRLTVLFLGLDSNQTRRDRGKGVLSDSIMVASINADQSELTLVSIPRDTVDVPLPDGTTWSAKINGIYGNSGAQGMVDAVEGLLQIDVDGYVQIDMGDLKLLIEAVGGVRVHPHAPLVDAHLDLDIPAGAQLLDGETALDYVRTRLDTDYSRAARQQEVIQQLVKRLVDPETDIDIPILLDTLFNFETDLPLTEMPTLIELARRAEAAEVTEQVFNPQDGFILREGDFGDGRGYILVPNIDAMRAFAAKHLAD
jgi:LCP family protein required for cell wall assembly